MNTTKHQLSASKVCAEVSAFGQTGETSEYHVMFHVRNTDNYEIQLMHLNNACKELMAQYLPSNVKPVFKRYFLSDAANQQTPLLHALQNDLPCAVSIVQQPPLDGSKISLWMYLVEGADVLSVEPFSYRHNDYIHSWKTKLSSPEGYSENQTRHVFEEYDQILQSRHTSLADNCIRTWLFVQNVDVNYAGVVKARREFFNQKGLTEHTHYIASTGIEGRDADPAIHVLMDAYAVEGLAKEQINYLHALTHLSPTHIYNVTFERGTSVTYGDRKHLFISGTASIDHKGEVVHVGDVGMQTKRMWENIEKLLEEGGADMKDIMSAIVYLRDASDYIFIKELFDERFPDLPAVFVYAPVCRPTWLIEMEVIAVIPCSCPGYKNF